MPFLDFLQGISPWSWVAFGIGLGAVEMATMSFFLIWPALAALMMAVLLWISPAMSPEVQIILFAVLSVALTLIGRRVILRFGDGGGDETLINNRAAQLVGRTGVVLSGGESEGAVEVDGVRWRASWERGPALKDGARVRVVASKGMVLEVSPLA